MNDAILAKLEEHAQLRTVRILTELKEIAPQADDDVLMQLYTKSVSIHQTKGGDVLEQVISDMLDSYGVLYRKQVTIDNTGIIIGFQQKKRCYHIIDFVVGDVQVGKSITCYKVLSCKTTCRERWTQDDWSLTLYPLLYVLVTTSDDYPSSMRFREDESRKIVTCRPKVKDDRVFKLNFDDILKLISDL